MFGSRGISRHSDVLECAIPTNQDDLLRLVEELKRRGNQAFSANVLEEAEILYSHAIEIGPNVPNHHILYSNRSATRLKMGKLQLSLEDADAAIGIDEKFAKGYFRRGQALMKLKLYSDAVDALTKANTLEGNNASVKKALQEAIEVKGKAVERPMSPKAKTAYNTPASTSSVPKAVAKKPTTSTKPHVEKIEDEEENLEKVRGYKKLADGRVTTFFNNELSEADKALIGDIAPQKIQDPTAVQIAAVEGGSAWNQGNTFEERDMTKYAHDRVTALIKALPALPCSLSGTAGTIAIKDIKDMSGDASIAVVRGAKRYIFDLLFTIECEWKGNNGEAIKGLLKFIDMSSDCGGDYDVEVNVAERYSHSKGKDFHQALSSKAKGGLQAALFQQLDVFVKEYQSH
ncbi:hsp90 [Thraustotheca clavata]|uniref:Hsp90 n=1 Tax=Thraustotheca clavata TaxID=74557 RepID=A0A1W0A740_9STRA|nr:hsp90 [Thraustotheca clavata]